MKSLNKYEFTGEKKLGGYDGDNRLKRIRAIRDFGEVKAGDLGGWIGGEENLSHDGNAWVKDNAEVCDAAYVYDNAMVKDNSLVCCCSKVGGNAVIADNSTISGSDCVEGNAVISGNTKIFGDSWIHGNAVITGNSKIFDIRIHDKSKISDVEISSPSGICEFYGDLEICGNQESKE